MGESHCPHCGGSLLVPVGERQYEDCDRCLTTAEQKAQALRCPCRGTDEWCPCQNVPDRQTLAARYQHKDANNEP